MLEIRVNTLTDADWDRYVLQHNRASWAHLGAWRSLISSVYNHPSYYFEAWRQDRLVGVLPAVHIASRLFGNSLVSMPYLDDGGVLADDECIERALMDAVADQAAKLRAGCDVRSAFPLATDWPVSHAKVSLTLDLAQDADVVWRALPSTRRNRIRKAQQNRLAASFHGRDQLESFYDVFCHNMRDLGSPVHSRQFFDAILSNFSAHTGLILVRDGTNRTVGAGLFVRFGDTMALPWVSCRRDAFELYPNMLLYWELIFKASQEGARRFDFGRSSVGSGTYEFKRQWGAQPSSLHWYSYSEAGKRAPQFINGRSTGQRAMIAVWQHLPLSIANRLGPRIRRSISL